MTEGERLWRSAGSSSRASLLFQTCALLTYSFVPGGQAIHVLNKTGDLLVWASSQGPQ